ncbi:MAG TPA: trehalase calcium-binding domain-containing protein, partial [Verrucomicrobiae bacterium]|nr:trehalase calcium-binding domain-containing protein [Verrucomicrobiae bacterium]
MAHILSATMGACMAAAGFAQTVPVADNLWRLVAQEDTDNDQKITIADRVSPFALRGRDNATLLKLTNFYQMSVLLQELKSADDNHL